ncbi:XdhC family protein [Sphingopyxis sp. RIFCSPHIGHO2_12_FULL_65_19]|uniref:XdhC family protein n=1 Tax=Sphingopyxis sp. RIFCSPHIGHO2_12_FULL_65_19 TaxID=1802172 RepID=UPI0008D15F10|nr:XdhC family protein [Sphingopyxis sp. RIFCSPHIGHO2_12_FULL_65_19]OHD06740.1 MAG: xanthine dehydrogenase [Sphingopyxis sp. RIFCSPHIGHO2_12_FULL_65_19]
MIATSPADILRFIATRNDEGIAATLVTLTGIEGSSPRAIGAQMAVAEDGRYLGSFSGGCVEAAVVAEAIETLADGNARRVRFGAGSPYLDIRLPCGSGIDLLFTPRPSPDAINQILSCLERREPAVLLLSQEGVRCASPIDNDAATGWRDDQFLLRFAPTLRILVMGQGEELTALARLAHAFGADICAMSPDRPALAQLAIEGIETAELATRTMLPPVVSDDWTAILSVFHDRDWEEALLPDALRLPGFYVGAIGSPRTQRDRRDALDAAGVPRSVGDRLSSSVGLIPATRDPSMLALSALAQIAQEYHAIAARHGAPTNADAPVSTDALHTA